jgi:iron complex outermembrane receptor protein
LPGPITSIDQTTLNVGEIRLAGYDVDLRWRIPTANAGRFTLSFSGTYFSKFDVGNPDGTFIPSVGNMDSATTGGVITRWKTYQAVNWALGPWDATLAMNWQSHYTDVPGSLYDPADGPVPKHVVGSYQTFDAQIAYAGFKNTRLVLGVRNLLDKDPPYTNQGLSFQNGYDPQYGDPRGRFIYARLTYAFE